MKPRAGASRAPSRHFDRHRLPTPLVYLQERGLITGNPRGAWVSIRCPVHKEGREAHASMRVNIERGGFRCMVCGARGGDILALHQLFAGQDFAQAARELGAMR